MPARAAHRSFSRSAATAPSAHSSMKPPVRTTKSMSPFAMPMSTMSLMRLGTSSSQMTRASIRRKATSTRGAKRAKWCRNTYPIRHYDRPMRTARGPRRAHRSAAVTRCGYCGATPTANLANAQRGSTRPLRHETPRRKLSIHRKTSPVFTKTFDSSKKMPKIHPIIRFIESF